MRYSGSAALVTLAAVLGLFFPSSIGGDISFQLGRVALVLNAVVFAVMLLRYGPVDSKQLAIALSICLWLSFVTLWSPVADFSPGALFIFVGLALLIAVRLREVRPPGDWTLLILNLAVFALGVGQAIRFGPAFAITKTYYAAFYPGLLVSMLDWYHKPVLTLATHSTAGFFYYLFFWLNFQRFRKTGSLWSLAWTIGMIALGAYVRSTTSYVLMAVAAWQLGVALYKRIPARMRGLVVAAAVPAIVIVAILTGVSERVAALAQLVEGTQTAGLRSRYSSTGMLGGNLRYLNESPLSPIGFTYGPEDLFYGDSGFVLVLVRGSLPLLVLVYCGYWRFLRDNLRDPGDARCVFLVTCAFEVGYVPLQLFRFTLFLPFMIALLNGWTALRDDRDEQAHAP